MKKIIIIVASLLLGVSSFAQPYKPCLDGEKQRWSFIHYVWRSGIQSTDFIAHGRTLINDVEYRILYRNDYYGPFDSTNNAWKNYVTQLSWQVGFVRESEDASKLYFYDSRLDKEYLMSDLDLQVGDTIQYSYQESRMIDRNITKSFDQTIDLRVDSIYFKNGLKHIYLNHSYRARPLVFIESIGPSLWPVNMNQTIDPMLYEINCFQNQTIFYKNNIVDDFGNYIDSNFSTCPCGYRRDFADNKNGIPKKEIRDHIANGLLTLDFEDVFSGQLSLMDVSGRMYYQKSVTSQSNYEIDISNFPKGIYILRVHSTANKPCEFFNKKLFIY